MAGAQPFDLSAQSLDFSFRHETPFALFRGRREGRIAANFVEAQGFANPCL